MEWQDAVKHDRVSKRLRLLERKFKDKVRFFSWWIQVERLKRENIPGAFAELGVYKGISAKILHNMDPQRKFYLFDTFEGFPASDLKNETGAAATYTKENFADTNLISVKRYISGNDNLEIVNGYFPETAGIIENEIFALVNIDVDLYKPTKAGLEFFYPRLAPGGVILVHDYNYKWEGIKKAVDEFSGRLTEIPILVPDKEGTILIIKNKKKR